MSALDVVKMLAVGAGVGLIIGLCMYVVLRRVEARDQRVAVSNAAYLHALDKSHASFRDLFAEERKQRVEYLAALSAIPKEWWQA